MARTPAFVVNGKYIEDSERGRGSFTRAEYRSKHNLDHKNTSPREALETILYILLELQTSIDIYEEVLGHEDVNEMTLDDPKRESIVKIWKKKKVNFLEVRQKKNISF